MAVFRSSRLDAYFLTIIAGIDNTERVASDFFNGIVKTLNPRSLTNFNWKHKQQRKLSYQNYEPEE